MLAGPAVSSVGGTTLFDREKKLIIIIKNGKNYYNHSTHKTRGLIHNIYMYLHVQPCTIIIYFYDNFYVKLYNTINCCQLRSSHMMWYQHI